MLTKCPSDLVSRLLHTSELDGVGVTQAVNQAEGNIVDVNINRVQREVQCTSVALEVGAHLVVLELHACNLVRDLLAKQTIAVLLVNSYAVLNPASVILLRLIGECVDIGNDLCIESTEEIVVNCRQVDCANNWGVGLLNEDVGDLFVNHLLKSAYTSLQLIQATLDSSYAILEVLNANVKSVDLTLQALGLCPKLLDLSLSLVHTTLQRGNAALQVIQLVLQICTNLLNCCINVNELIINVVLARNK